MLFEELYISKKPLTIENYLKDCFNIEIKKPDNLSDYYNNFYILGDLKTFFVRVPNTETSIPKKGDIVVWNSTVYGEGLIEIANGNSDVNSFESWQEDRKVNSHNYDNILGYLRPRNQEIFASKAEVQLDRIEEKEPKPIETKPIEKAKPVEAKVVPPKQKIKEVDKPTTSTPKEKYIVGSTYTTQKSLKLRSGAGADYRAITKFQINKAEKDFFNLDNATCVTIKPQTKLKFYSIIEKKNGEVWGKIHSGYICIKDKKGVYVV